MSLDALLTWEDCQGIVLNGKSDCWAVGHVSELLALGGRYNFRKSRQTEGLAKGPTVR